MTATAGADPTHLFDDAEAWQEWLAHNHDTCSGVWLKIAKKRSGAPGVSIADALDGRWAAAYQRQSEATAPPDLEEV